MYLDNQANFTLAAIDPVHIHDPSHTHSLTNTFNSDCSQPTMVRQDEDTSLPEMEALQSSIFALHKLTSYTILTRIKHLQPN